MSIKQMNVKRIGVGALALIAVLVSEAKTWYFTGVESETGTGGAWEDATKWKDADGQAATAFVATDTYVVTNQAPGEASKTSHAMRIKGGTFANGARLEVSGPGTRQTIYLQCEDGNPTRFDRGFLFGKNAYMLVETPSGVQSIIEGDVDLTAINGGYNPQINNIPKNADLVFKGKVKGGTTQALQLFTNSDAAKRNFTVRFLDDVTFGDELYVREGAAATTCGFDYNIRLVFGDISFSPKLRIDGYQTTSPSPKFGAYNRMRLAVNSANDTVTLKNGLDTKDYLFHSDTYLEFPVDAAAGKAGKMVSEKRFYGSTNEWIGVVLTGNPLNGTATNRLALLSVPVAYPLNAAAFHLVADQWLETVGVKFEVEDDATSSTLYVVIPPIARYVKSDSSNQFAERGTFIESAEGWSNGLVPQPGCDYLVLPTNTTQTIRTPDDGRASYVFPGHSLTIAGGASLRSYIPDLRIDSLRLLDGSSFYWPQPQTKLSFTGDIDVSGTVRIGTYTSRAISFGGVFTGSGTIDFGGHDIAANAHAVYVLTNANPDFSGKMILRTAFQDPDSVPSLIDDYGELQFGNVGVFGADLATLTPDAFLLKDYAQLKSLDRPDMTIAKSSNRGIAVQGNGRIWTIGNLRLETSLTVDGTFYKEGVGKLRLACPIVGVNGNGSDHFVLRHGTLTVGGHMSGVTLQIDASTSLAVNPDPDNAAFTAKGLDFSSVSSPITLADTYKGKLPLSNWSAAEQLDLPANPFTYAVMTVKTADADAVRAMLPTKPPQRYKDCKAKWVETTDETAGTVTFAVENGKYGMALILR